MCNFESDFCYIDTDKKTVYHLDDFMDQDLKSSNIL